MANRVKYERHTDGNFNHRYIFLKDGEVSEIIATVTRYPYFMRVARKRWVSEGVFSVEEMASNGMVAELHRH